MIPEDWGVVKLRDCLSESPGYGINAPAVPYSDQLPVYIRITDISEEGRYVPEKPVSVKRVDSDLYYLNDGDIVFARTGASVGKSYLHRKADGRLVFAGFLIRVRTDRGKLIPAYLAALVTTDAYWGWVRLMSMRSGQPGINGREYGQLPLAIPPLPEQRAIAEALGDVDALLGALDAAIAKQRDLKQAAMQQLLTGQTRLPGFQGEWEVKTVGELEKMRLVKLSRGQVISKKHIDNTPGDCPIYSSSIHNDGLFGCYGDFMFDEELITWSVDGGGNFFHRRKHKFSVTNVCGFMRVDTTRINYRFFAAELQLLHSRKSFDYQSKAHPSVVRKEYEAQIPPLPEQAAIANVWTDMDTALTALESRRTKTAALKQAMMQELLTGRIRLLGTPSPSSASATSRAELGLGAPRTRPV